MALDLYPYQKTAAAALAAHDEFLLLDQQRVGKSPSAIRAADKIRAKRVLWLTNGNARTNHGREWLRFQQIDRPIQVRLTGAKAALPDTGVVITSYDLAAGALRGPLSSTYWDLIVCDEFHKLQGRNSKRTEAVLGVDLDRKEGLAACSERAWFLSGTPAPRTPAQLWPTLHAVFPHRILNRNGKPRDYWSFVKRYTTGYDGAYGYIITGTRNIPELKAILAPISLRRTLAEVEPDLPAMRFPEPVVFDAGKSLKALLEAEAGPEGAAIKKATASGVGETDVLKIVAASAPGLRELTGLTKVEPIAEMIEDEFESEQLKKIVIFAWHRSVVERLAERLKAMNPCVLYGGMAPGAKQKAQDAFREDPNRLVFIGNILAAGEAIDLSVSDDILFAEWSTVPGDNSQACFRCTNSAKRRSVMVRFATLAGSVDEKLTRVVASRTRDLAKIFD